jgi:hypothetical protein
MGVRITKWNGPEIARKLLEDAREAIDETTEEAARQAAASAPHRTGRLAEETISEPAVIEGDKARGKFGSTQRRGFYGLFLERRQPFLRPAADATFPTLARRIKGRM